ncbi:MAG: hypothetical protein LDL41_11820 [Coleofasciculus sp. S288]|nr:hypothetical protein [Coleofasciculus sp. S288]
MQNSQSPLMSQKTKDLIDKLLIGKLSLADISKITGISEQCLQSYVDAK